MTLLLIFITSALIVMSVITLMNMFMFPRLRPQTAAGSPKVSVLIPARNEADRIEKTLHHHLGQDYSNYEIILLDDHSTDDTHQIAQQIAANEPRLRVVMGKPLPENWLGKNWACQQLSELATGEYLIFTDADVAWNTQALSALVAELQRTQADVYSVWSTQHTITWAERLCVPLMALVTMAYLPIWAVHHVPIGAFGTANGQCMAWRREAYRKLGGHAIVADNVLEDVTLARKAKGNGLRLRLADANKMISCRMYTNWSDVRDGYAKNILAGYGNSVIALIVSMLFHWLVFFMPWIWLLFGWLTPQIDGWPFWALSLVAMGILVRALTAAFTHQRILDALLLPFSVLLMTRIALHSLWWHYRHGGTQWKGRFVPGKHAEKYGASDR